MSSVSYTVTYIPGHVWTEGETWTPEKANAAPTISVLGPTLATGGGGGGGGGSVSLADLANGMFTADAAGIAPFATGWLYTAAAGAGGLSLFGTGLFTADAYGRRPFANGWLTVTLVATGTFAATTAGRAPFADGFLTAAKAQPDAYWYAVTSGGPTAYTATFSPDLATYASPALSTYPDGMVIAVKFNQTCGAAPTLNVNSTAGARTIYRLDGAAIQAGDLLINSIYELRYNSTLGGWQMTTAITTALHRSGTGVAITGSTAKTITWTTPMASIDYAVQITQTEPTAATAVGFPTISAKSTTGFTVQFVGAPNNRTIDWLVTQNVT